MKKIAVALAALLALTACGGNDDSKPAEASQAPSDAPVETSSTPTPSNKPEPQKPSLRDAVEAYSHEFLTGHGYDAYDRLTKRCQATVDRNYFAGLTLAAKERYGNLPIKSYEESINGDKATVTYTYANAEINQSDEPWVLVKGAWLNDDC